MAHRPCFPCPHCAECPGRAHSGGMPPWRPLRGFRGCQCWSRALAGRSPALWNSNLPPTGPTLCLSGEDQVKQVFAVLEPFWPGLDLLISVQHVQNAVLRVELFVFPKEITVHLIIYSFEIINIGLVGCWSWRLHVCPFSKGLDTESLFAEDIVHLHALVMVAWADHCYLQLWQWHGGGHMVHTLPPRARLLQKMVYICRLYFQWGLQPHCCTITSHSDINQWSPNLVNTFQIFSICFLFRTPKIILPQSNQRKLSKV